MEHLIKLWKEKNVKSAEFQFSCGGDSMGDTQLVVLDGDNKDVSKDFLRLEDEVYKNVDFYVNSDGVYQGEFGTVIITLNDEENEFEFNKDSRSDWSESANSDVKVSVSPELYNFIKENVTDVMIDSGWRTNDLDITFKNDCLIPESIQEQLETLRVELMDIAEDTDLSGEFPDDWEVQGEEGDGYFSLEYKGLLDNNEVLFYLTKNYNVTKYDR